MLTTINQERFVVNLRYADICDFIHSVSLPSKTGPQVVLNPIGEIVRQIKSSTSEIVSLYVKTDYIKDVLPVLGTLNKKIILFTGSSDFPITKKIFCARPANVVKWFGENVDFKHEDLIPVPIGSLSGCWVGGYPADLRLRNHKDFVPIYLWDDADFAKMQKKLALCAFSINTNDRERLSILNHFKDQNFISNYCSTESNRRTLTEYQFYLQMALHRFVFSPPGNGIDCGRTWGALQVGAIPIVKDSIPIRYFKDKVPLFVYEDIQEVTQEKLEAFCPKWPDSPSILDIEYYKSKIDHLKYQFS